MPHSACSAETIVEALVERAHRSPDGLAYVVGSESVSYGDLHREVQALASGLAGAGVGPGGRCALILPTGLDFIRLVYATQALGAAPVAINPALSPETIQARLRLVRADLAIASEAATASLAAHSQAAARQVVSPDRLRLLSAGSAPVRLPAPDETAFLQFTSGTEGEPRAVVIRHGQLRASLAASRERLDIRAGEVMASWVPLHHDLGLVRFLFGSLYFGCPCHLLQPSIANLGEWLATVSRVGASITAGPDFCYRLATRLVDPRSVDLRSLAVATNGGEAVRWTTIEAFEERFGLSGVVRPGYGLAEATLGVASLGRGEPLRLNPSGQVSCGRAHAGLDIRIVDAGGHDQPTGVNGEIAVRGDAVFAGYFDDERSTREVMRGGWLHTGDIGSLDDDGHLFVSGRARALIKRAGATIVPREIEEAVDRLEGVRFSAAVGVVSSVSGTDDVVVVAEASSGDGHHASLIGPIDEAVRRAIGTSAQRILVVAPRRIPRTSNGKIRYEALRALITEGVFDRDAER